VSSGALEPIPAVDLSGARVVRLLRGVRERETVYGDDPLRTASDFAAAGARWLHVVDLDAAFGDGGNREAILRLLNESPLQVQVAGGVRSLESYGALREAGAARVVFGTVAVEAPRVVEAAIRMDAAGVAVALDVRGGRLQTRGWVEPDPRGATRAGTSPEAAARHWGECGASAIVYTSVERDGTRWKGRMRRQPCASPPLPDCRRWWRAASARSRICGRCAPPPGSTNSPSAAVP